MAKGLGFRLKLVALAFLCIIVINLPQRGEAAVDCNAVATKLVPCVPYIKGQGDRQQCCPNVQSLIDSSNRGTTADRQAICNCLESFNSRFSDADIARANTLPQHCGRSIPYTLSRNMDCSSVR